MLSEAALNAHELVRRFGGRTAVNNVSLTLHAGECLALFGPNGAGKTTLLRMLGGQLRPTKGHVELLGHRLPGDAGTRSLVGLISHHTMLYGPLTARENVLFAAQCHGVQEPETATMMALARMKVDDRASTPVRQLSRGLQQRVSIARALVASPRLVLLDEPYTGLDETGARALTHALRDLLHTGAALVMVTHHLAEGLDLSSRAAIMLNGKIVRIDEPAQGGFDLAQYSTIYRSLVAPEDG